MASAWLDIDVDWENPIGGVLPAMIAMIIEAYEERVVIANNNNTGVRGSTITPLLTSINLAHPNVLNDELLNEINTRLEDLLTKSQNRTTATPDEVKHWTVDEFLTEKGLPLDLIPEAFNYNVFDPRWLTYWFYILNETFLLYSFTWDDNTSGNYRRNPSDSRDDYATAVAAFIVEPYDTFGGDGGRIFSGLYEYDLDTTPTPEERHDIRQRRLNDTFIRTRDASNALYEIYLEVRLKLYITNPAGYEMTWNYSQGDIFDISSNFIWDGSVYRATDTSIPNIVPQIDASTLGVPDDTKIQFKWACGDNLFERPTYIYTTDLNDVNLISYLPIV